MFMKKYHRKPTGMESEFNKNPLNYDDKASLEDLKKMIALVKIKFENHIDIVKRGNKAITSLNSLHQQFLKICNNIEKLNV